MHLKKILVLPVLLLALLSQSAIASFSDVPTGHTNNAAVTYLERKGIIGGYSDGTFRPTQSINRAEFLKIVVAAKFAESEIRAAKSPQQLSDAPASQWYGMYVAFAQTKNIINGYQDGTFRPTNNVNLAEALKIIVETYQITKPVYVQQPENWYDVYIDAATSANILTNVSTQNPAIQVTRGDVAQLISNVLNPVQNTAPKVESVIEEETFPMTPAPTPVPVVLPLAEPAPAPQPAPEPEPVVSDTCDIKGNISSSKEKIYHYPGCTSYNATIIDESKGERWFCSEEEAVQAGWRVAKNC